MKTFTVTIDTSNAAFDHPDLEVARILRALAGKVDAQGISDVTTLFDSNGNKIGQATHK